jgi:hypothetical protein
LIRFSDLLSRLERRGVEVVRRPLVFEDLPGIGSFNVTDDDGNIRVWVFCTRMLVPFAPLHFEFPLLGPEDEVTIPVVEAACAALKVDFDVVMGFAEDPDDEPET